MKNYSFPPEVHVGGHVFRVELLDAYSTTMFNHLVGDTSEEEASINVATRTQVGGHKSMNTLEQTLLHETVHQISNIWDMGLEEHAIEQLAQGLLQALHSMGVRLITEK